MKMINAVSGGRDACSFASCVLSVECTDWISSSDGPELVGVGRASEVGLGAEDACDPARPEKFPLSMTSLIEMEIEGE